MPKIIATNVEGAARYIGVGTPAIYGWCNLKEDHPNSLRALSIEDLRSLGIEWVGSKPPVLVWMKDVQKIKEQREH